MQRWAKAVLILSLLVGWIVPVSADAQAEGPIYVVEAGDTLWGIAFKFGLDAAQLAEANGMTLNEGLAVGRELVIPGFQGVSGVLATRSVEFGETLQSLSLRHGLTIPSLTRLNRVVNPERLFVGQDVIYAQGQGDGLLIAESAARQVSSGETDIELSMRTGLSAWALRTINDRTSRMWSLPGEMLSVPAAGRPTTALPPDVESVSIDPLPARQGRTSEVEVRMQGEEAPTGALGPWELGFMATEPGRWVALQGVHAMAEPGMIDLHLSFGGTAGPMANEFAQPVYLASGDYGFDPILTVPDETIDPEITGPENEQVAALVAPVTPERMWDGPFLYPAPYTESFPSLFGSRRNYNGTGYDYYHAGLDFYGGTGTQITAPARGQVVFAGPLTVRGNTTIVDHGWGIYTVYLHQSEIMVSTGDSVEPGETIGLVGATGRVTGPHLHWEVWVGGVPVDPL
ncbi:MAG: peptidoglycan DD-metalloendopeptidase family protein [Chloroflexi bacterium]|nr:peptidoglycan DD-metalloendopeptidase family protein [Chloroflexota bacterium]